MRLRDTDYKDLILTAECCDLKDCNDCPSEGLVCCRERVMCKLAEALEKEHFRVASAESRAEKAEKEIERLKEIMRDKGIIVIPSRYPGCKSERKVDNETDRRG